jgi:hypothetical protein
MADIVDLPDAGWEEETGDDRVEGYHVNGV